MTDEHCFPDTGGPYLLRIEKIRRIDSDTEGNTHSGRWCYVLHVRQGGNMKVYIMLMVMIIGVTGSHASWAYTRHTYMVQMSDGVLYT